MTKQNKFLVTSIIACMIIVPYSIRVAPAIGVYAFYLLGAAMIIYKKYAAGFPLLFIAAALCQPSGWLAGDISIGSVTNMNIAFLRVMQWMMPILAFCVCSKKDQSLLIVTAAMLMLCGFIQYVHTDDDEEIRFVMRLFSVGVAFYAICKADKKITLEQVFFIIDIMFFISAIYAIAECLFNKGPYIFISEALSTTIYGYEGRAKGLLGHPLNLSGLIVAYQAIIFTRKLLLNKFYVVTEVACVFLALLTVSRTSIIGLIGVFLFYMIISTTVKRKNFFINIGALVVALVVIYIFGQSFINALLERIDENYEHRLGSYETTWNLIQENFFGVGYNYIMHTIEVKRYATEMFSERFTTLDNFYLSIIVAYGIFAVIIFAYYFGPLIHCYRNRKKKPMTFKGIAMMYSAYIVIGFSYDWETSFFMNMLLWGTCAYIERDSKTINLQEKEKTENTKSCLSTATK